MFERPYEIKNEALPESYADLTAAETIDKIKDNFENRENEKENFPFHNSLHTKRVTGRIGLILETINEENPELVSTKIKSR